MLPTRWTNEGTFSPFDSLFRLRNELDRFFDRTYGEAGMMADRAWTLPVDVTETDEHYRYVFEVPGFRREDLELTLEGGLLTVTGERRWPHEEGETEGRSPRRTERRYGRFVRSVRLPGNVNLDEVEAVCENGLLTVTVPRSAETRPRRIQIGSGAERRQLAGTAN